MTQTSLLSLPADLLHHILLHADYRTLTILSETNTQLHAKATSEIIWRHLAQRRFRVRTNTPNSKRLQAAGPISWRTLYANWHMQHRMPVSRHSGPAFRAFAKGGGKCHMWVCVSSADDCRLRDHGLRLRVIVQNVDCGVTRILKEGICLVLVDGRVIRVGASGGGVHAKLFEWSVERAGSGDEMAVLRKDDFVTIGIYVSMPGAVFEVDALERLHEVRVPITGDATEICAATFVETEIWEAYDLLPGGWWARRS